MKSLESTKIPRYDCIKTYQSRDNFCQLVGQAGQKEVKCLCLLVVVCVVTFPRTLYSKVVNFASTASDWDLQGLVQMTLTQTCWDVGHCGPVPESLACLCEPGEIILTYPYLSYLSAIIQQHERLSASQLQRYLIQYFL